MKNFVLDKSHGILPKDCKPLIVDAKVVRVREKLERSHQRFDRVGELETYSRSEQFSIDFEFEYRKRIFSVTETFNPGDVIPNLGQWVRGIAVCNQWGSYKFVTTHLWKDKYGS